MPMTPTTMLIGVMPRTQSIRHLYAGPSTLSPFNLVTIMQDLWFLLLVVIFAALTFGLVAGCAALGARK